jgi:class 3 adenylate cyclase
MTPVTAVTRLPSGTVTLLFTDIEGSTRLLRELGRSRYIPALEAHRDLLREAFARHGGVEVEMQGDSFFFAFARARHAVAAAADGQRALASHDWADRPIRVRMGLHTGEPDVTAAGLYAGLDVHRAARVMSVGAGGQVLLSARTADLVEDELPPGLEVRPVGTYLLKDFERPEALAQLVVEGLPTDFPQVRAPAAPSPDGADGAQLRRRRRRLWAAIATLIVLGGAAATAAIVVAGSGGGPPAGPTTNAVVSIDPADNSIDSRAAVGTTPTEVAVGTSAVWVLNAADGTLTKLDGTGRVLRTIGTTGTPTDVATTPGFVWVADRPNKVLRLDATTGNPTATAIVETAPSIFPPFMFLASDRGAIWVAAQDRVSRIDATTMRVRTLRIPTPDWGPLAVTDDAVWESTHDVIYRLDRDTGRVAASVPFPQGPIVAGGGSIWALNAALNVVGQIDTRTNALVRTISVGANPSGIAFGEGSVWVASQDGTVTRIDPVMGRVVATVRVGGSPQGIAIGHGRVWVSVA